MEKIRKSANAIERFLHSRSGERFFNIAYSVGAAIIIWGVLFEILHLKGAGLLLCIGMGTEIVMFLLMAFDTQSYSRDRDEESVEAQETGRQKARDDNRIVVNEGQRRDDMVVRNVDDLSEVVAALGRNVAALNALCELQLKSTAGQVDGVESVGRSIRELRDMYERSARQSARYCEETEKMTQYVVQLNAVYRKMIDAMSSGFERDSSSFQNERKR